MGNVIFFLVFIAFVGLAVLAGIKKEKADKQKKVDGFIRGLCDNDIEAFIKADKSVLEQNVDSYIDKSKDVFRIDEITWNDLSLDLIFEKMNRTITSPGEEYLYNRLHNLYCNKSDIEEFSKLSKEVFENKARLYRIIETLISLGKVKGKNTGVILNNLFKAKKESITKDVLIDILLILSFGMIFVLPGPGFILFLCILVYTISAYFKRRARMEENLRAFCFAHSLVRCMDKLSVIFSEDFFEQCKSLDELHKGAFLISTKNGTSSNLFSIIADYVRMIFHVDIILYNLRLARLIDNKELLISLYEKIGMLDAAIAVASYKSQYDIICEPKFVDGPMTYNVRSLYHPLTNKIITNDIESKGAVLITGSNASGKSTFLKMVGLSIVFAQSMGFALADSLELSYFQLYTSMAIKDNILGEESYYVVESKSLKRICDALDLGQKVFCIVDEVLKGTNTRERIAASANILSYLSQGGAYVFAATHDKELTDILSDDYELYFFSEIIEDGNVVFPYKINKGVADKGNAIKLLELLGYNEAIVKGATKMSLRYEDTGKWELK